MKTIEMLMFSISKQSLHENMEREHVSASNSSMCWTKPLHKAGCQLLAQDHDTASLACLWNPCTGDKLPLPDIVDEEHQIPYHCKCLLSHKDPAHLGCVIVLFNRAASELWYCHTGNNSSSWRHYSYDIGNYPSIPKPPKRKRRHVAVAGLSRMSSSTWLPSEEKSTLANLKETCAPQISRLALPRQIKTNGGLSSKNLTSIWFVSPKDCAQADSGWLSRRINSLPSPLALLILIQTTLAPQRCIEWTFPPQHETVGAGCMTLETLCFSYWRMQTWRLLAQRALWD